MKGKIGLLMMVFIVISYFLYQYGNNKSSAKQENKSITITGIITGNSDDVPVSRATIELQDSRERTMTNENGEFKISAKKGQKLFISHPYYKKKVVEVTGVKLDIKLFEKGEASNDNLKDKVKEDFPNVIIEN